MAEYGRQTLNTKVGEPLQLNAGGKIIWMPVGMTVDWSTVPAVTVETTLASNQVIPVGAKYLRYGLAMALITASGLWGPADTTATDGRELITRDRVHLINQTIIWKNPAGWGDEPSDHVPGLDGALVWLSRLLITGVVQHPYTAANLPSLAALQAALPMLRTI